MQRRSFLAGMFAACAAPAFIRAEVLMPVRGLILPIEMSAGNTLITCEAFTREALKILERNLRFTQNINKGWDSDWVKADHSTLMVRRPNRYQLTEKTQ